jgi:hypothetical protein
VCISFRDRISLFPGIYQYLILFIVHAIIPFQQRTCTTHLSARQRQEPRHQAASKYVHVHPLARYPIAGCKQARSDAPSTKIRPIPNFHRTSWKSTTRTTTSNMIFWILCGIYVMLNKSQRTFSMTFRRNSVKGCINAACPAFSKNAVGASARSKCQEKIV